MSRKIVQNRSGTNSVQALDAALDLHRFNTREVAEHFQKEWNLKLAENNTPDLADLQGVARHQILAAVGKLKVVGATLDEAGEFFLRFGRPPRGKTTIEQVMGSFLETKSRKKRSE